MPAVKRLAGVAPEVNLRSSVQARKRAHEIHPGFETSPQGYQWPHKKDVCPPKILKKQKKKTFHFYEIYFKREIRVRFCMYFLSL